MQLTGFNTFIGVHFETAPQRSHVSLKCNSLTLVVLASGSVGLFIFHRNTKRNEDKKEKEKERF